MAPPAFPIRMFCTLGLRGVMTEFTPALAGRGLDFTPIYGATSLMLQRMAQGETADMAILTDAAIADLIEQGIITADSRRDLARSAIRIAVRAGAPKPDIGTAQTLKQTPLAARTRRESTRPARGLHIAAPSH